MSLSQEKICILGGGFGGLYTALRLSQLPWDNKPKPEIVLIDKSDRFLFTPLLYEIVTGEMETWEIAPTFSELLKDTPVKFYQDEITDIDLKNNKVKLSQNDDLDYTKLVISLGGITPSYNIEGIKEYAIAFHNLADGERLKNKLRLLQQTHSEKIRIAIIGGGYTGVELGCKLADILGKKGRIRIIEKGDTLLKNAETYNQKMAQKALENKGIWLDLETNVKSVGENYINLDYKGTIDKIPVELVLWTVGTQVSPFVKNLSLPHHTSEKLLTNKYLQILENDHIFALGDLACLQKNKEDLQNKNNLEQTLTTSAKVALQQADYCGWNLWASINDKPLLPFRYQDLGEMMTLGINNGTLSGLGIQLDGILAYLARRLIYLYRFPTWQHQLNVGINWLRKPLIDIIIDN